MRDKVSRPARAYVRSAISFRERLLSPVKRRSAHQSPGELAHYLAQTAPVLASTPFVGKKQCVGSVECSLHEMAAHTTHACSWEMGFLPAQRAAREMGPPTTRERARRRRPERMSSESQAGFLADKTSGALSRACLRPSVAPSCAMSTMRRASFDATRRAIRGGRCRLAKSTRVVNRG